MASPTVRPLLLLFDRPNEPILKLPRGNDGITFVIQDEEPAPRANDPKMILVKPLTNPPSFEKASKLPPDADFSVFIPFHQECAAEVIDEMMRVPQGRADDLLSLCVYARQRLNPELFVYCYSVALLHRPDTKNIRLPHFLNVFPSKFLASAVLGRIRKAAAISAALPTEVMLAPITIPREFTASDLDMEHHVAYFREDIGVNLHHWHWHLAFPFKGPEDVVNKDRRGELFYYMHQQLVARYNAERLNNNLNRVKRFNNWEDPIPEGYFSKLTNLSASANWPPRQPDMCWTDVARPDIKIAISDMLRARRAVDDAIADGVVINPDGSTQPLDMDTLGNMVEASQLSPNLELYGNVHNHGHLVVACMHDPDGRFLEPMGIMSDQATAMRDPFFFRWHGYLDDWFHSYKESSHVPRYTDAELGNPIVEVTGVKIMSEAGENTLTTFWMQSDVKICGLDFAARAPVAVRFTHLNHRLFSYRITVNNTDDSDAQTTVRIFLAPKFNERHQRWSFGNYPRMCDDYRKMFIEMDRFVVTLNPGSNTIYRQSTESSVTIPFEQTFPDPEDQCDNPDNSVNSSECSCGWPQHMLVPKGSPSGVHYQLFVMCSDYNDDEVDESSSDEECKQASSYCGVKGQPYPDARSMGFPFDRPWAAAAGAPPGDTLDRFLLTNMKLVDVTIKHLEGEPELNPANPNNYY